MKQTEGEPQSELMNEYEHKKGKLQPSMQKAPSCYREWMKFVFDQSASASVIST